MKTSIHKLAGAVTALLFAAAAGQVNAQTGPFYLRADAGGTLMQSITIKSAGGAKNGVDAGGRLDLAAGYYFTDFLAGELEIGALGNQLKTGSGEPLSAVASRVELYQVPVLANVVLELPLRGGVTPYIGAGAGGVTATLAEKRNDDWRDDSDVAFAYQAMAGVKVKINRHMEVGAGYKFMGTMNQSFFDETSSRFVHTGDLYTHSILATFVFHF